MTVHSPVLTKKQISETLHLDDLPAIGNILESLVAGYQNSGYNKFDTPIVLPRFLEASFGPPLDRLPSFATLNQKRDNAELVAKKQGGIKGIGEIMEAMHGDMRRLGGKAGKLFAPSMKGIVPTNQVSGVHFDPEKVQELRQYESATIELKQGEPPLEIHYPEIRYHAFMAGAEARSHLSRSEDEKKLLRLSVGTLKNSFISINHLLAIIHDAMEKSPDFKGKTLDDYELKYNTDKITTAFYQRQKEFSTLYNFLYVASAGNLDPHLQELKWVIDRKPKPESGINIDTPAEAASVLFAVSAWMSETEEPVRQFCDRMALVSNKVDAVLMLKQSDIVDKLKSKIERIKQVYEASQSPVASDQPANPNQPVERKIPSFIANTSASGATAEPFHDTEIPYDFLLKMVERLQQFQEQHQAKGQGNWSSQDYGANSGQAL